MMFTSKPQTWISQYVLLIVAFPRQNKTSVSIVVVVITAKLFRKFE